MLDMLPGITNTRRHARTHPPTHARQQRGCNSLRDTGYGKDAPDWCGLRDGPLCPWVALAVCGSHFALEACLVLLCSGRRPSKGHQHVANKGHATRICDIEAVPPFRRPIATLQNYYDLYCLWECAARLAGTQAQRTWPASRQPSECASVCLSICAREMERECECVSIVVALAAKLLLLPLRQNRKLSWHNSFYFPACCVLSSSSSSS